MAHALDRSSVIAVVGSGAMGSGIAQVAASAGHRVLVYDTRPEAVTKAIAGIGKAYDKLVEKGRMGAAEADLARERLQPAASLAGLKEAALVVEAIVEDLDVKRKLFAELEDIVAPESIRAAQAPGAPGRHALLQPGAADGAGRGDQRRRHR
jgi:3-hydroxybutyryl-CoA dehydrogenase